VAVTIQRTSRRRRKNRALMSDINVTPFVDVMLVLLIIFMVTAPLLTVGVQVDLPDTKAGAVSGQDEPLAVSVDAGGQIYIQDTAVDLDTLVPRLHAITGNNPDIRIFVRGDKAINYGRVMAVMGQINAAGYRRVALIAQEPGKAAKRPPAKK
jgi:biopolymer transport protein TolR|tara:strand:- start:19604 stop:20062 length:459 start_codon:yes stop_codon:yes gene_type:complete